MSSRVRIETDPAWSQLDVNTSKYSQSLERGLAILKCFTSERLVLGIADIADELGMSRSTTHRYVTTLVALGYLEQDPSRKYRLGLAVTDLGVSVMNATGLREHGHAYLEEQRGRLGCPVSMATLDGLEIVIVDYLRSYRRGWGKVNLSLQPGSRLPAYCTAMGKVLLAYLRAEQLDERLSTTKLVKSTSHTIGSKKRLGAELRKVAATGLAFSDEEFVAGLVAVAAPVRDPSAEVVAAVSMSAPVAAISVRELEESFGPHLVVMADRISARLGFRQSADG